MSQVTAAVQAVFQKRRGELTRRVGTIEDAVAAILAEALDESLCRAAERDAHKLAGSLGMFGFQRGSQLARELEHAFGAIGGPSHSEAPRLAELALELRSELDDAPTVAEGDDAAGPPLRDGRALLVQRSVSALHTAGTIGTVPWHGASGND